jgi:hypothetical protein
MKTSLRQIPVQAAEVGLPPHNKAAEDCTHPCWATAVGLATILPILYKDPEAAENIYIHLCSATVAPQRRIMPSRFKVMPAAESIFTRHYSVVAKKMMNITRKNSLAVAVCIHQSSEEEAAAVVDVVCAHQSSVEQAEAGNSRTTKNMTKILIPMKTIQMFCAHLFSAPK